MGKVRVVMAEDSSACKWATMGVGQDMVAMAMAELAAQVAVA